MFSRNLLIILIFICVPLNAYADMEENNGLAGRVAELEAQVAELTALLAGVSRVDVYDAVEDDYYDTLVFTGMNLQILSGIAEPPPGEPPTTNGMGNLIIGYNRARVDCPEEVECVDRRTGSHNLVMGGKNNYTSFSSFVSGGWNEVSAPHSAILSAKFSLASGHRATVTGGFSNIASGTGSSVSGGAGNTASAFSASVSGGKDNLASGDWSSVSGGQGNIASGEFESISGLETQFYAHTDNENAHHVPAASELDDLLDGVTRFTDDFGYDTLQFSAMNVQIVNGEPFVFPIPEAEPNGLGNLIIGHNSTRAENYCVAEEWVGCEDERSGSHTLVVGEANNYTGNGGVVVGAYNEISGHLASITGGAVNVASGDTSSILGGIFKTAEFGNCVVGDNQVDC
jgi:hypothetical protein